MAIEDKKIEIPSFVKKMDDESIIKMAKDIALGEVNVYAPIENADSKIVGFKRVCLYDNLKNENLIKRTKFIFQFESSWLFTPKNQIRAAVKTLC